MPPSDPLPLELSRPYTPGPAGEGVAGGGAAAGSPSPPEDTAQRFAELMPRLVRRALASADDHAINQAIADGGFVLNDCTVVMRHNAESDQIEFFADVGVPDPHALEVAYRAALEINLCRTYPGITLGVHPQSGRMVATTSIHSLLVADDEVCLNALELLTRQVDHVRGSRVIPLRAED